MSQPPKRREWYTTKGTLITVEPTKADTDAAKAANDTPIRYVLDDTYECTEEECDAMVDFIRAHPLFSPTITDSDILYLATLYRISITMVRGQRFSDYLGADADRVGEVIVSTNATREQIDAIVNDWADEYELVQAVKAMRVTREKERAKSEAERIERVHRNKAAALAAQRRRVASSSSTPIVAARIDDHEEPAAPMDWKNDEWGMEPDDE